MPSPAPGLGGSTVGDGLILSIVITEIEIPVVCCCDVKEIFLQEYFFKMPVGELNNVLLSGTNSLVVVTQFCLIFLKNN